jgi:hypothetical protein
VQEETKMSRSNLSQNVRYGYIPNLLKITLVKKSIAARQEKHKTRSGQDYVPFTSGQGSSVLILKAVYIRFSSEKELPGSIMLRQDTR